MKKLFTIFILLSLIGWNIGILSVVKVSAQVLSFNNSVSNNNSLNVVKSINSSPVNDTVCVGEATGFSISVSGNGLTYKWQRSTNGGTSWSNITSAGSNPTFSGWTSNFLGLSNVVASNNGNLFKCIVSYSDNPSDTSLSASLTVNVKPTISVQPVNKTTCDGTNTNFSVTASGTSLIYQWQLSIDGGASWNDIIAAGTAPVYSGWDSGNLQLIGVDTANNNFKYRCNIIGVCTPDLTSNVATLTVNALPSVVLQPLSDTVCVGGIANFSIAANGVGLTYKWQRSINGGTSWTNITAAGTSPVFSGWTSNILGLSNIIATNNGNLFRCVVSGTCSPAANSLSATLTVNVNPSISMQPTNKTTCDGTNTNFSLTASGTSLIYQWQLSTDGGASWNDITTAGTGPVYSGWDSGNLQLIGVNTANNNFKYRCNLTGVCTPDLTSNVVTLTVNALPVITIQPISDTVCVGDLTNFSIAASGAGLTYKWQRSTNGGTSWVNITAAGTSPVFSGWTSNVLGLSNITATNNGNLFRCVVSGTCSPAANSLSATLTVNISPVISMQPTNKTTCDGTNTNFSLTSSGTSLTYHWQLSTDGGSSWNDITTAGTNPVYSGWDSGNLQLMSVDAANNGFKYRCNIFGVCPPDLTSNIVTLSVNDLPSISMQPLSDTICAGEATNFNVIATGAGLTYKWQRSINGGITWTNITAAGTNPTYSGWATATLGLINVAVTNNGTQYRCVLTGTCLPSLNSAIATLNVGNISTTMKSISICSGDSLLCSGAFQTTNGVYFDTVPSMFGCDSIIVTTLTVKSLPQPVITGNQTYCAGSSAELSTGNFVAFNWSNAATTQTINATIASNPITVAVTDNNGCVGISDTVILIENLPAIIHGTVVYSGGIIDSSTAKVRLFETGANGNHHLIDSVPVGANGSFILQNFPEGSYYVHVKLNDSSNYQNVFNTYYNASSTFQWSGASIFAMQCGMDTNIVIHMYESTVFNTGHGYISGKVNYCNNGNKSVGAPVAGAEIFVEREPYNVPVQSVYTNLMGNYNFNGILQGIYTIYVDIPGFPMIQTYTGMEVTSIDTMFLDLNFFVDTTASTAGIYIQDVYEVPKLETADFSIALYPNPVKTDFNIEYSLIKPGKVNIEIIDIAGKVTIIQNSEQSEGMNRNNFNTEKLGLQTGTYLLKFTYNKNVYLKKFVIR